MDKHKKAGASAVPQPNFRDFSGPPNGDYVRYVDALMQWALQEQAHARLKALGEQAGNQSDSYWGRVSAKPQVITQLSAQQPGGDTPIDRWKRKAQAAAKLAASGHTALAKPKAKTKPKQNPLLVLMAVAIFALVGFFASPLLPVVIIGWVVFNVIRAVRAASASAPP